MTGRPIRILSERVISTSPEPGQTRGSVAVQYQVPPLPPSVVFVDAQKLPDVKWRLEHPDGPNPTEQLVKQGDAVRRQAIEDALASHRGATARTI